MNGVINVYKKAGMTSHDVVYHLRKIYKTKKVGHTGTLDPMAEGVLPVCIGAATRISGYLLDKDKTYRATLMLGVETDTYDREGTVVRQRPVDVQPRQILEAVEGFVGPQEQVPPIYSALKKDGKKYYEYARKGIPLEIPSRPVIIHRMEVTRIDLPYVELDVSCSKGTYIRSLVHDMGEKLGCGAHMTALERTSSGSFFKKDALTLDRLYEMTMEELEAHLVPMETALSHLPSVQVRKESLKYLINGVVLFGRNLETDLINLAPQSHVLLFCGDVFYGIGEIFTENALLKIKPKCIFNEEK